MLQNCLRGPWTTLGGYPRSQLYTLFQVLPLKGLTVRGPSDSVQSVIEQLRTAGELDEFTVIGISCKRCIVDHYRIPL